MSHSLSSFAYLPAFIFIGLSLSEPELAGYSDVWTIHKEYLVYFVIVQNLTGNHYSCFHNIQVFVFCYFGLKMHISCKPLGLRI